MSCGGVRVVGAPRAGHVGQRALGGPGVVGTVGARVAVLVEGDVVRHVGLRDLLVRQEGVAGGELRVSGNQDGRHDGGLHPLVVVGVDADLHLFGGEGVLAELQGLQLVVRLEVRPAPDPAVDDVR